MFGPPGHAYVYLVYGMYDCLNIVTGPAGDASALLVRAIEPLAGIPAMREARTAAILARRRFDPAAAAAEAARIARLPAARLASGPGLVAAAFSVNRGLTGMDLCDLRSTIHLELPAPGDRPPEVRSTPRVGVAYAGPPWVDVPWRFIDGTSPAARAGAAGWRG